MWRVEDGEEAQQVGYVVKGYAIDGYHVVGVVATLYVQSCIIFGVGLYARQQLGIVHRVGIAQNAWHIVHHT